MTHFKADDEILWSRLGTQAKLLVIWMQWGEDFMVYSFDSQEVFENSFLFWIYYQGSSFHPFFMSALTAVSDRFSNQHRMRLQIARLTYINIDAWQRENLFHGTLRGWKSVKFTGAAIKLHRHQRRSIQVVLTVQRSALASSYAYWFDDEPYWSNSTITETWNERKERHDEADDLMFQTYLFHISCRC